MFDIQFYIDQLKKIKEECANDGELAHYQADSVLCDILVALGYEDVVAAYNEIPDGFL